MRIREPGEATGHGVGLLLHRWSRLAGLLVAVVLVVGIGVGVRAPSTAPPSYSASQQAQLAAEDRFRSLADAARTAASVYSDTDPPTAELLLAIVADLEVQADAVALPRPPDPSPVTTTPTGDPSAGGAPGTGTAPGTPSTDGPQLLLQLRGSALASLADAVHAEPGPARVLAAAGANQWQRALALSAALGVDAGLPAPDSTTTADLAAGTGFFAGAGPGTSTGVPSPGTAGGPVPPSPSTMEASEDSPPGAPGTASAAANGGVRGEECAGAPLGSEADRQALQNARIAEDQARYGYRVAAALLEEDRAALLQRAAEHGAAAQAASERLVDLCETPDPTTAGFTLPPAFRADPLGELLRLEQQHVHFHAGLVAMTSPETRAWAAVALTAAVVRSAGAGAGLQPLPGIEGPPQSSVDDGTYAPTPENTPEPTPEPAEGAAPREEPPRG